MSYDEQGFYEPDKTNDLLGLLLREYYEANRKRGPGEDPRLFDADMECVQAFTKWARTWLTQNYVVATYPVEAGLGVRLKEGQVVPFTPQNVDRRMRDEAIHITDPGPDRVPPNPREYASVPITGR